MDSTKSAQDFPYKTYLNILYSPLELIDVQKLADACTDKWYNQTLCTVNDSVVRLAVIQGIAHSGCTVLQSFNHISGEQQAHSVLVRNGEAHDVYAHINF